MTESNVVLLLCLFQQNLQFIHKSSLVYGHRKQQIQFLERCVSQISRDFWQVFTSGLQLLLKLFEVCIMCVLYLGMSVPNENYICL